MGRPDRDLSSTPVVDNGANRIALLTGLIAGIAYSTFASFVANALHAGERSPDRIGSSWSQRVRPLRGSPQLERRNSDRIGSDNRLRNGLADDPRDARAFAE